ncbi:MAG: alpha/beta hydrolase [Oscillospiraceae bacterium]|nr:alpha/beta hydrolase [Oscillospiraceae bacterium]
MNVLDKSVLSSDGSHLLRGKVYLPEGEVKGYFHIVHGMTEHIGRYDRLMSEMAEKGYIAFGYDHLGHGATAGEGELGFIASSDGWKYLCLDVERFACDVIGEYGDMPYYLMGHSMGSFIVRLAVTMGAKPTKLIVMGTGGKNPAADIGLKIIGFIKKLFGEKHISKLVENIAFGSYNKRFPGEDEKAWLTNDMLVREKYMADPYCNYKFTVSAMEDLVTLNRNSNLDETFKKTSHDMPILLVSGSEDPVGDYGEGVKQVYESYKRAECDVKLHLYNEYRHEILNDKSYEKVVYDIVDFIG